MSLHLRDTLSRAIVPVIPLEPGRVRMYACGPTVYRFAHVGNLRTFLIADLIRRVLLYHGLEVLHVQNITDVGHLRDDSADRGEDRMLIAAGLEGRTSAEIADGYEAAFHADAALLNLLPAHVFPRATEHIPEMVALAERLEDLGHAYATPEGNVYYAVATFPGYGMLSGNSLDELRAGHRGDVEPGKRDAADFALWKAAGPGRALAWDTPRWGRGFPGWHLECSAMAMKHLGPRFDIHTGGEDNVFPHHEDEIAQSAPIVGGPPATIWVHGAHLLMRGRKMAKSAGNFQRITELVDADLDPLAFRYLCLGARYARKLDYSETSLASAAAGLQSLRDAVRRLGPPPPHGPWAAPEPIRAGAAPARPIGLAPGPSGHGASGQGHARATISDRAGTPAAPLSPAGGRLHAAFVQAIDRDLDMPAALRITRQAATATDLAADERRWIVLDHDAVLGLDLDRVWADGFPAPGGSATTDGVDEASGRGLPDRAAPLMTERARARAARDFARADALRDELRTLGVEPIDRADGTADWRPVQAPTARSERSRKRSSNR
ncbi:MAG: cysteine--tRNA ligase [Chloroflexi bacterium]|nr:cysteine--tRNA ligase [Chloroflexota bacterium]